MAVITFMSDFGTTDHYVAAVKAAILSSDPQQVIVDITHDIKPFDIAHAAYVLKHVYMDFPEKTVHLVAVDAMRKKSRPIALVLEGHYFVGFDSGLFSLISNMKAKTIRRLSHKVSTFPAKVELTKAALALAQGESIEKLGESAESILELYPRRLKITKREIAGNVISIDHYGNLITNIKQTDVKKIQEINENYTSHTIRFGREAFDGFHAYFTDVESGDCFVLFNSSGNLQIGINKGNASELLGLGIDAPVIIEFNT
ncbi:MAG: SAM-dependent chlorinase/fluorinase [Bacteroidota bacterium]